MLKVYIVNIGRDLTTGEYQGLLSRVSAEKQVRAARFRDYADKQRMILGDLLARAALSELLSVPADQICFVANEYGKLALRNDYSMHFNISHSGRYVVCAVCDEPVGIDVERLTRKNIIEIANRFFHAGEKEYIESFASGDAQSMAFTSIWTMKESYIKRDGRGLSIPLPSFNVLDLPGITFHQVLKNDEAVCFVCSGLTEAPEVIRLSVDGLIGMLEGVSIGSAWNK